MNGKQHRQIAPLFTIGACIISNRIGLTSTENIYVTTSIASAVSVLFANALDADLYATYPVRVILNKSGEKHTTRVKRNGKVETKQYTSPKGPINKIFALFFKMIGVTKHRDWKSHSPIIYGPLGFLLLKLANKITDPAGVILGIMSGIVFGIWSHILADMPNKGGIQFLPGTKNKGIANILPKFMHNWFRSGSKFMYFLIIAALLEMFLFIISKDTAIAVNQMAFNAVKKCIKLIWDIIEKAIGK